MAPETYIIWCSFSPFGPFELTLSFRRLRTYLTTSTSAHTCDRRLEPSSEYDPPASLKSCIPGLRWSIKRCLRNIGNLLLRRIDPIAQKHRGRRRNTLIGLRKTSYTAKTRLCLCVAWCLSRTFPSGVTTFTNIRYLLILEVYNDSDTTILLVRRSLVLRGNKVSRSPFALGSAFESFRPKGLRARQTTLMWLFGL
jgi:hypothetical protein